jgi:hypothetical protein
MDTAGEGVGPRRTIRSGGGRQTRLRLQNARARLLELGAEGVGERACGRRSRAGEPCRTEGGGSEEGRIDVGSWQ